MGYEDLQYNEADIAKSGGKKKKKKQDRKSHLLCFSLERLLITHESHKFISPNIVRDCTRQCAELQIFQDSKKDIFCPIQYV